VGDFIPALVILVLLAAVVRDDTVLTLCYLLGAVYFVGRWWSRRAFRAVAYKRVFSSRAFPNEVVTVSLDIENTGRLPVVWLSAIDSAVPEISSNKTFREVLSLGPRGRKRVSYDLHPYKRGYFPVGPLFLESGDLFGLGDDLSSQGSADHLTVYPRIIPFSSFSLPSRSPFGTLRHTAPIFEDPARVIGKRDYTTGDSLRRVDWKSTAAAGRMQVRQFEPSLALEASILLDLKAGDYERRSRYDATELAVVLAASAANFIISRKQAAGLVTNAFDAATDKDTGRITAMPTRKGRPQLMRLLEVLARAQMSLQGPGLPEMIRSQSVQLAWGTTVIVITGQPDGSEELLDALLRARRGGLEVMLIFMNHFPGYAQVRQRAQRFGISVQQIVQERDFDKWRR
jgi:uncharacterized protein (DUF58 family)